MEKNLLPRNKKLFSDEDLSLIAKLSRKDADIHTQDNTDSEINTLVLDPELKHTA